MFTGTANLLQQDDKNDTAREGGREETTANIDMATVYIPVTVLDALDTRT